MNKLWVYGCSFSEPFGLLPPNTPPTINEDGTRDFYGTEYWGTLLAKKLNRECVSKGWSGIGWNYIVHQIEQDVTKWSKDDIIIISPSFFERVNIMEFIDGNTRQETVHLYKDWNAIFDYNELRWRLTVTNFQKLGYNIYTWLVSVPRNGVVDNLITAPDNSINWYHWMEKHYEYWQSLPGVIYPAGDWHFNEPGHVAVAERMFEVITK